MKKSVLHKVATVVAVLAIGGVSISHDALARGGGGGGGGGEAVLVWAAVAEATAAWAAAILAAVAVISVTEATLLVAVSAAAAAVDFATPFFGDGYGDYGYYNSDCWSTQHGRRVWVCD